MPNQASAAASAEIQRPTEVPSPVEKPIVPKPAEVAQEAVAEYGGAEQLIEQAAEIAGTPIDVPEAEGIIARIRREHKEKITQLLKGFVKSFYIETENKDQIIKTLNLFGKTRFDFVDLLLYVRAAANEAEVLSFDKDFLKIKRGQK